MLSHASAMQLVSRQVELLDLEREETPAKPSSASKKNLLDLPTEILQRILEQLFKENEIFFQVCCSGRTECKILRQGRYKPMWQPEWIPNARLVCIKLKNLASPILADCINLRIYQSPEPSPRGLLPTSPSVPIQVSTLFPRYLTSRNKNLVVVDWPAITTMSPVAKLDISDMPNVKTVTYSPIDIAETLSLTSHLLRTLDEGRAIHRVIELNLKVRARDREGPEVPAYLDSVLAPEQTLIRCLVNGPEAVLKRFFKAMFLPMFGEVHTYAAMIRVMIEAYWKIDRDNVIGLKDSAMLSIEFYDSEGHTGEKGHFIAFMDIPPKPEKPNIDWLDGLLLHKNSTLLDEFR